MSAKAKTDKVKSVILRFRRTTLSPREIDLLRGTLHLSTSD